MSFYVTSLSKLFFLKLYNREATLKDALDLTRYSRIEYFFIFVKVNV